MVFNKMNPNNNYPQQNFGQSTPQYNQNYQNQSQPQNNQAYPNNSQPQYNQGYSNYNQPQYNNYQQQYANMQKTFIMNYSDNLFRRYDNNNSGYLDVREIYPAIAELYQMYGQPPPPYPYVIEFMKQHDQDKNGLLSMQEFRKLLFYLNGIPDN